MERIAVYPGTFDPLTLGHFDLLQRSAALFDRVVVVVAGLSLKSTGMFDLHARMAMIRESIDEAGMTNVGIDRLDCLLVDYCRRNKIGVVVRGLRVYSDFEYEFQMALINKKVNPELDTLFLTASEAYTFLSSTVVKEMAFYGASIEDFVPAEIVGEVMSKFNNR